MSEVVVYTTMYWGTLWARYSTQCLIVGLSQGKYCTVLACVWAESCVLCV